MEEFPLIKTVQVENKLKTLKIKLNKEFTHKLNKKINQIIEEAIERMQKNRRNTLMEKDL